MVRSIRWCVQANDVDPAAPGGRPGSLKGRALPYSKETASNFEDLCMYLSIEGLEGLVLVLVLVRSSCSSGWPWELQLGKFAWKDLFVGVVLGKRWNDFGAS